MPPRRTLLSAAARPATAATPMAFVRAILLAYRRAGRDPAEALRRAQIAPPAVRERDGRITARQMELVSDAAMRELDDEALGWFSRRLPWGSYGLLCRASLGSPDLGVALKRWCRHHRILTEDALLSLSTSGGEAAVEIEERRRLGALREFCLVSLLRYVHGYACWAVDSSIPLRQSRFPFPAPPHRDVYPIVFPGPVAFGAARAGFSFDAEYLQLPIRRDERALRLMLQRALPLTVRPYRRDRLLVRRVEELLRQQADRFRGAEHLALELHLSVRTLHRRLREEGSSLQALKDRARRDLAVDLLRRTSRPVKQVAAAAGFTSEKSFARAFKGWTGAAPAAYRAAAGRV